MKINSITIIAIIVIAAVGLMVLPTFLQNNNTQTQNVLVKENDHIKGSASSDIVLIEYSDFECPACGAYYPMVKALVEKYKDDIKFIYRHFPITQIHRNAVPAAVAAEAAGKQGKFFEMHDLLFENQQIWSKQESPEEYFISYAEQIGLDLEKFKSDLKDSSLAKRVQEDFEEGRKLGVTGTPTFFLNGKKLQNPRTLEDFSSIIEAEINKNKNI